MDLGVRENCYWCDKDMRGLDTCDCLKVHNITPTEFEVGMALFEAEFCDHFCCGLPDQICKMRSIASVLAKRFELKIKEKPCPYCLGYIGTIMCKPCNGTGKVKIN